MTSATRMKSTMSPDSLAKKLKVKPKYLKELLDIIQENIPDLEVRVFGSRAKNGEVRESSDIDLLVRDTEGKRIDVMQWSGFKEALDDSSIPYVVDVLDWYFLAQEFINDIGEDYIIISPQD